MTEPAFSPTTNSTGQTTDAGPPWNTDLATASLNRIRNAPTIDAAHAQATVEAVILLHSIRRILLWAAVIILTIALIFGLTWGIVAAQSDEVDCPTYSSRC